MLSGSSIKALNHGRVRPVQAKKLSKSRQAVPGRSANTQADYKRLISRPVVSDKNDSLIHFLKRKGDANSVKTPRTA
jgi:hypothetical protein